jgi:hypothetical protein
MEGARRNTPVWRNLDEYYARYEHPIWKTLGQTAKQYPHGPADYTELDQFVNAVRKRRLMFMTRQPEAIRCVEERRRSISGFHAGQVADNQANRHRA